MIEVSVLPRSAGAPALASHLLRELDWTCWQRSAVVVCSCSASLGGIQKRNKQDPGRERVLRWRTPARPGFALVLFWSRAQSGEHDLAVCESRRPAEHRPYRRDSGRLRK